MATAVMMPSLEANAISDQNVERRVKRGVLGVAKHAPVVSGRISEWVLVE